MKKMKLTLGSMLYNFQLMPQKDLEEYVGYEDTLGAINDVSCEIVVSNDIPTQSAKLCFFHEVVHGMLTELGLDQLSGDEGFVDAFARQLYIFFHRNNIGKIMKFIEDNHAESR